MVNFTCYMYFAIVKIILISTGLKEKTKQSQGANQSLGYSNGREVIRELGRKEKG